MEDPSCCWCCGSLLTTRDDCPVCDWAGLVSPPHVCRRTGSVIDDEHGCESVFATLPPDHETERGQAQI